MKILSKLTMLAVAAFGLATGSVYANSFDLSYDFDGPAVAPGNLLVKATFDGTQNGNLVTDISNVALTINGISVGGTYFVTSLFGSPSEESFTGPASGAVGSIDGTANDFAFVNSANTAFDSIYFESYNGFIQVVDSGLYPPMVAFGTDYALNSSWSLVDPPSSPVPDSGTTASLLGLSVLGLVGLRRKLAGC
jgi:hypothetical protein